MYCSCKFYKPVAVYGRETLGIWWWPFWSPSLSLSAGRNKRQCPGRTACVSSTVAVHLVHHTHTISFTYTKLTKISFTSLEWVVFKFLTQIRKCCSYLKSSHLLANGFWYLLKISLSLLNLPFQLQERKDRAPVKTPRVNIWSFWHCAAMLVLILH